MKTVVLYHGPSCADGFGSAWAAHEYLGKEAEYLPVQYGGKPPRIDDGSRVYIVDFSYPRDFMVALAARCESVTVIDHHKTAREVLGPIVGTIPNLEIHFDESHSGAYMTWRNFHPSREVPVMIKLIQDRDLWTWAVPNSREYSASLAIEPKDFDRWSQIAKFSEFNYYDQHPDALDGFLGNGRAILAAQDEHVAGLASRPEWKFVGGRRVPAVNSPLFQSEIGEKLCELHPEAEFAAVYFIRQDGREVWSLRSRNGFDVSQVAMSMGGGGHAGAAGFVRDRQ